LTRLPAAVPPARSGRFSPAHLSALAGCARRHPAPAARDEDVLVAEAERLDADAFAVLAREWEARAAAVDGPDPTLADVVEACDELHVSRTFDGRYQLNGNFGANTGGLLSAALDAEVDRHLRAGRDADASGTPAPSRLRAAALVDLVAQTMRREPSDASVPDRYRVTGRRCP
jgi:hypothetical protein